MGRLATRGGRVGALNAAQHNASERFPIRQGIGFGQAMLGPPRHGRSTPATRRHWPRHGGIGVAPDLLQLHVSLVLASWPVLKDQGEQEAIGTLTTVTLPPSVSVCPQASFISSCICEAPTHQKASLFLLSSLHSVSAVSFSPSLLELTASCPSFLSP